MTLAERIEFAATVEEVFRFRPANAAVESSVADGLIETIAVWLAAPTGVDAWKPNRPRFELTRTSSR
jgi:hypothetical protein